MPVELNPNYPSDLDAATPVNGDFKSEGDDNFRNLKRVLKNTLPNVTGAITATHTELNVVDGLLTSTAELNLLDGLTATAAELNILDGALITTAELNILDGVTATAAELNALDGITATVTELNYTAGVTSAIQTQLNLKAPLASPALTGVPTAPTAAVGTGTTQIATTAFVAATSLVSALPGQTGNSGKVVTTDGTNASWALVTTLGAEPTQTAASQAEMEAGTEAAVRSMSPLRVKQAIQSISGVGDHAIVVTAGNGHGSTNTKIRRFTTTQSSAGTHVVYADSAANGASFTIAVGGAGLYEIYYMDNSSAGAEAYGISLNSAQLTTDVTTMAAADRLAYTTSPSASVSTPVTVSARLVAGDVVRAHTTGVANGATALSTVFKIRKIGL